MAEVTKFRFGNTYPDDLYVGNSLADRVYYGSELVYGFAPPIQIELVEIISFTNDTGGAIPNYVDDTHFGILLEMSAVNVVFGTQPGWTLVGDYSFSAYRIAASFKKFEISDRGTNISFISSPTVNDYDQLYIFRNLDGNTITDVFYGNYDFSNSTNTNISINSPTINPDQGAISFHYFYTNSTTFAATSNPSSDQVVDHSNFDYVASQYKIWNGPNNDPINTVYGVSGSDPTIQIAFWIIIE